MFTTGDTQKSNLMIFQLSFRNIWSRPVRTTLAIIGMTVAIFAMVSLYSVSAGLDRVVSSTLSRVPGLVAMQRGAPIPLFSAIPVSWMNEIEEIPGVTAVAPECWSRVNVINGKTIISPPRLLCGTDITLRNKLKTSIYRGDIYEGRFLSEEDLGLSHAVISREIGEEFDIKLGDSMVINGHPFTVVGFYHTGSLLLDVAIITDIDVFRNVARFDPQTISSLYIEHDALDDEGVALAKQIQDHFKDRNWGIYQTSQILSIAQQVTSKSNPIQTIFEGIDKAIKDSNALKKSEGTGIDGSNFVKVPEGPLEVKPASQWASRIDSLSEDLDIFLFLMTSIGIVIAVVQVVNTMLMSVTERVIEFGILRANGWSVRHVVWLVLVESAFLGLMGGLGGALVGWIAVQVVNYNFPTKIELYAGPSLIIYAIVFSTIMGMLGGLYPAMWAASRSPIDAIRRG